MTKEDKSKPEHSELHAKIEKLMGPPPDSDAAAKSSEEVKTDAKPKTKPESTRPTMLGPKQGPMEEVETKKDKTEKPKNQAVQKEPAGTIDDADLDKALEEINQSQKGDLEDETKTTSKKAWELEEDGPSFGEKVKSYFTGMWSNPKKRKKLLVGVVAVIVLLFVVPVTRYFILNTVGFRSSASVKVLDAGTGQPLKNVTVNIAGKSAETDDMGYARVEKIKLGKTALSIERVAFADSSKTVTIGWGSNPLGDHTLEPVGLQYSFKTIDYLSGQPVVGAEAFSGEASAFSNESGEIVLTLDTKANEEVEVMITADGYRTESQKDTADDNVIELKMVPANKHAFVSDKSGEYDVYTVDADGKNEKRVLSGSGSERDDIILAAHPEQNKAALVSTREGVRNSDGYLLSTLTLIDLDTTQTSSLGRAERFQIIGWSGNRLMYVQIGAGTSAANKDRHRLLSYDFESGETTEVATSNYFNAVTLVQNKLYYAPSANDGNVNVSLFRVDPDGQNTEVILGDETWNMFRKDYDTLTVAVGQTWYEYAVNGEEDPVALDTPPENPSSRNYIDAPDGVQSAWIDQQDGKGVLLSYDKNTQEDKEITKKSNMVYPVRWLNPKTIVYRVVSDTETADYAVNIDGGEPKKIVDVSSTVGIENWYYY